MGLADILKKKSSAPKQAKISTKEMSERVIDNDIDVITYNAFGFISMADGCNTPELIQNVVQAFEKDKTVCVVDLEEYYPKILKIFDVAYKSKTKGLSTVLVNEREDIRDHLLETKYPNIYVLAFSEKLNIDDITADDLKMTISNVRRVIEDLKARFNVVIINIPNSPYSEYSYAGILATDEGFIVTNQQTEWSDNYYRFNRLVKFCTQGLGGLGSFNNVIVNNYIGIADDFEVITKMDFNLLSIIPLVPDVIDYASQGRSYVAEAPELDSQYVDSIETIVKKMKAN